MTSLRVLWCRFRHKGEHLKPHPTQRGAWQCYRCGSSFASLADAGAVRLGAYERSLSGSATADLEREVARQDQNRAQFEGAAYTVFRGGLIVKGRDPGKVGGQLRAGQPVRLGRIA